MMVTDANGWERGPFDACQSIVELLVAVNSLLGLTAVGELVAGVELNREQLREAANEAAAVGLLDLAELLRKRARRAKPRPLSFKEKHLMRMAARAPKQ